MKKALQSRWSLDPWAIFLVSVPTLFIIPASESNGQLSTFWGLALANFASLIIAVGTIWAFSITPWIRHHWLLVLIAGGVAGAIKGYVLWLVVEEFNLPQPELVSRIVISSLSWVLFVLIMAIIQSTLGEIRSSQQEVIKLLAQAQQKFDSLESQRQWLINAKVSGLETKLAKNFVQLLESLNSVGKGPSAYVDIAKELREAARGEVRVESNLVWQSTQPSFTDLAKRTLETRPSALLTLLAFLVSSGINTLRLSGVDVALLVVVGTSLSLYLALKLIPGKYGQLFAPVAVFVADLMLQGLITGEVSIYWALAASIWSLSLILTTSAFELARLRIEEDRISATQALSTTQAEIEWLSIQLEATNLELAKYLHSILQTRLMSHALLLEQRPQESEASIGSLVELLTKPMSDFGSEVQSLEDGLDSIVNEWRALVEISIINDSIAKDLDSPTLLLIREAISNAVHHGLADKVLIEIQDTKSTRSINVFDNGIGPTENPAGLGTQTYESLCSKWSLSQWGQGGSHLALQLKLI